MKMEEQLEKIKEILAGLNIAIDFLVIQDEMHKTRTETTYNGLVDIVLTVVQQSKDLNKEEE